MKISHVFFDLDRTLWDFEANSAIILNQLIDEHGIEKKCRTTRRSFINTYLLVNQDLWQQYRKGHITKDQLRSSRFYNTMLYFGYENESLGKEMEAAYIHRSPQQQQLIEGSQEVLNYLKNKYTLHIITNGFKEVQHIKIENSGLSKYFEEVFTSDHIGWNKPDQRIFEHALRHLTASPQECVMIGDDLQADVRGAMNAGIHAVYFNPDGNLHEEKPAYEIRKLTELMDFL